MHGKFQSVLENKLASIKSDIPSIAVFHRNKMVPLVHEAHYYYMLYTGAI